MVERDNTISKAVASASSGDYWHECFSPICVVIDVTQTHIVYCDNIVDVPNDKWTWGVQELKILPRDKFIEKVQYGKCEPKCHMWAAEAIIGRSPNHKKWINRLINCLRSVIS